MNSMNQALQPVLRQLVVVETGTYNDQHYRPYVLRPDMNELNAFAEIVHGQTRVSPADISAIAGKMLHPSTEVGKAVQIANGWGSRRCRFIMKVDFPMGLGQVSTEVITGFTDYVGVVGKSGKALFDNEMRFYINNTVTISETVRKDGVNGGYNAYRMIDNAHVITPMVNNTGDLLTGYGQATLSLLRPHDVLGYMQTSSLNGEVHDTRNQMLGMAVKKSRRGNNLPADYLSRSINALVAANEFADHTAPAPGRSGSSSIQEINRARGDLKEPVAASDLFMKLLNSRTGFNFEKNFTFGELLKIFTYADSDQVTSFSPRGKLKKIEREMPQAFIDANRGSTEYMNLNSTSRDSTGVVVAKLCSNIPALMMDLLISEINFTVTNELLNGKAYIQIEAIQMFVNVDKNYYGRLFIERLESEVIPDITNDGHISFMANVYVDVLGDTNVRISQGGQAPVDYVVPSFCDGLFTPVVSDTTTSLSGMAHDVKVLASHLSGPGSNFSGTGSAGLGVNFSGLIVDPTQTQQVGNNNASVNAGFTPTNSRRGNLSI